MTRRQGEVLEAVKQHLRETGVPPTVRELMARLKIDSSSTVQGHLDNLVAAGELHRDANRARTLRLPDAGEADPIDAGRRFYQSLYPGADWEALGSVSRKLYTEAAARYDGRELPGVRAAA